MEELAGQGTAFKKSDTYWISRGYGAGRFPSGVRVRRIENNGERSVKVTWKDKERQDGVEVNEEKEFALGDAGKEDSETFELLLNSLGFEKRTVKYKEGLVWKLVVDTGQEVTVELCKVCGNALYDDTTATNLHEDQPKDIGWFLELEVLTLDTGPETIRAAKDALFSALNKVGVGERAIDARYYTELLRGEILSGKRVEDRGFRS
jgi:adenylate cyclase class IV